MLEPLSSRQRLQGKELGSAIERDYLLADQQRDYDSTFGHYGMDGRPT